MLIPTLVCGYSWRTAWPRQQIASTYYRSRSCSHRQGLEYLHSLGVMHMDLKSLNVLVDADVTVAKLSDFGLRKVASTVRTSTGGRPGKVNSHGPRRSAVLEGSAVRGLTASSPPLLFSLSALSDMVSYSKAMAQNTSDCFSCLSGFSQESRVEFSRGGRILRDRRRSTEA